MFWANVTIELLLNSGILVEYESGQVHVGIVGGNNLNNLYVYESE